MSKKPAIEHEYDPKKDRLEITHKHFSLNKKRSRTESIDNLKAELDKKSASSKRGLDDPIKNTRLEQVGD